MSATVNLSIDQGTSFSRVLTIKDDQVVPVAIDLTGYTFSSQARVAYATATPAFSFVFTIRDQVALTGQVEMTLAPSVTSALVLTAAKAYLYDVEMVSPSGEVTRLFEGKVTITPEVTR